MAAHKAACLLLLALAATGCAAPDPKQELTLTDLETYWAIDPSVGPTHYMAPVVRFHLENKGASAQHYVQATATFRRKGQESQTWGSGFEQVASTAKPLAVGKQALVVLKSDARYYSTGSPDSMFQHELFKDTMVEVFVRVGSSGWVKMGGGGVERRIGAKSVQGGP